MFGVSRLSRTEENGSAEPENDIINWVCCSWELDNQKSEGSGSACVCEASPSIFCSRFFVVNLLQEQIFVFISWLQKGGVCWLSCN